MKQTLLLIAAFVFFCNSALLAQSTTKITGQVLDNAGKSLANANVLLNKTKDSSLVKTAVSSSDGKFNFVGINAGEYFVAISSVGYQKNTSPSFTIADGETKIIPALTLSVSSKNLQSVVVESKKPMVEVKADKTIMNVEGTINAVGNDALELLRKAPGVMIDKDDNLSLAGKNGVQVYIDGKPSPLSGADLAAYLKSLQSSQIEAIELITNPSAKYEAAGNAGIINIKLKKNKNFGTNGNVNAGYNIGTYAKYNGGLSLNNRNAKMNVFGNYNYSQALNENNFVLSRTQGDSTFNQTNHMLNRNKGSHNFKAGADFFVNKKSTIGLIINGNISSNQMETDGPMHISYKPTNTLVKILKASSSSKMQRDNVNFNLNYRYAVTGGKELNIDADYGFFNLGNNQFQPNNYYDASGTVKLSSNVYRMISPADIDIASFKTDYEQNFKKGRLGLGGKIGFVNTDNNFKRYDVIGITDVYDKDRSNRFVYKENINAVYANYNRPFKGFMLQAGLRIENTNSKGVSSGLKYNTPTSTYVVYDSTIKKNYTDFFPSVAITLNKNPMKQWGFTYSRRIDRPAYQDLNPFEFKLNDYTFMKGNTELKPQYTNSFGITNTYKYRLTTQLNYSHVKNIFTQMPDTTEKSKSFLTKRNLATQDIISLNVSYPYQYKWYSFFANVNSYYSMYKADFGGGDRKVNLDVLALTFYMQNSFKLGKGYTAELSGFYASPTIWQGTFKSIGMYSIDGGLQKTILKGKGNLKAAVSDIFQLMKFKGTVDFSGQQSTASGRWESRQFKLNFSYRFGNNQVKASRQRKVGIEEENKRTEGGGTGGMGGQ
ncbi:MAG: TonB-dependent receptor [Chitinophagaceae bacterium]|nr:TonB-dependent receptor [Chitinophagaceae bacterium]